MSQDAQTVTLRVQVVDMQPFTLDLQVPTYLPARDLTQRIARDAGLDAYWQDGRRRLYWLRARGRLVEDQECLSDLAVVNGELVYLLPEPPAGSGVVERPPDYPANQGYQAKGTVALLGTLFGTFLWTACWGVALGEVRNNWTVAIPAMALGLITTSFARHAWGGQGSRARIAVTSVAVLLPCMVLAVVIAMFSAGESFGTVYRDTTAGLIFALVGIMIGWLAWWGAVEPLPLSIATAEEAPDEGVAVVSCGLCSQNVLPDVRAECPYGCGRFFHSGCYQARISVYTGDQSLCGICGVQVR
jgi:hypothetical protein